MSTAAETWQNDDVAAVQAIVEVVNPAGAPGYLGAIPENETMPDAKAAVPSGGIPVWCGWRVEWDRFDPTFDPTSAPLRAGRVVLAVHQAIGVSTAATIEVMRAMRAAFAASSSSLTFSEDIARPVPIGDRGEWHVTVLLIPFMAG